MGTSGEGQAGVFSVAEGQTLLPGPHWYQRIGLARYFLYAETGPERKHLLLKATQWIGSRSEPGVFHRETQGWGDSGRACNPTWKLGMAENCRRKGDS